MPNLSALGLYHLVVSRVNQQIQSGRRIRTTFSGYLLLCFFLMLLASCGGSSTPVQPQPKPQPQNPAPTIQSLSPAAVAAGTSGFTLTIGGSNFLSTATLTWNGTQRMFAFVSSSELTTQISAADLDASGNVQVIVANPAPGGGQAFTNFTISPPAVPAVASISPNAVEVGSPAFTLAVTGSNFVQGSVLQLNSIAEPTTYVDNAHLTALIPASVLMDTVVGNLPITVTTPAPGGGGSNSAPLLVEYPRPSVASLSPNSAILDSSAFTLTVNGSNFVAGATVFWGGSSRATQFVSSTELTASILASDVATAAGDIDITVQNPSPSAGTSNVSTFALETPPVGTFTFVQKSTCTFLNSGTTCSLPVSPNLAPGNLDIFACFVEGVGSLLTGRIISSVSAGGKLITSKAVMGEQQSDFLPAAAYILPSTSTGGISPIVVTISQAVQANGGSSSCYLAEWQPSANPGGVALDNDGALAYASTNTPQGPSFQLSGKNDVLLQMYANANGFATPLSVSPPYDALADLGSASYSTAVPESGNGPTWTLPSTIGVSTFAMAFGWNPAPCSEQSFIDFAGGVDGARVTDAGLTSSTHGWQGGLWSIQTVGTTELSFSSVASKPLPAPTGRLCSDGNTYADAQENLGLALTLDGVATDSDVARYAWIYDPVGPVSVSFNIMLDMAQNDPSNVDCFALNSVKDGSAQTMMAVNCYGTGGTRHLSTEDFTNCTNSSGGPGNGANVDVKVGQWYTVQLQLIPGIGTGAGNMSVYDYPGPLAGGVGGALIGTSNVSGCTTGLAYGIGMGKGATSGPMTTGAHIYYDTIIIDLKGAFPILLGGTSAPAASAGP